jgi:hypothetical protein
MQPHDLDQRDGDTPRLLLYRPRSSRPMTDPEGVRSMKRSSSLVILSTLLIAAVLALPTLAAGTLEEARIAIAPDGVLFLISDGVKYRVTPQEMSAAELGAIPEGAPLPVGRLAPLPDPQPAAAAPRVVRPGPDLGLSRERPIPLGWTCSCTTDRAGLISQFDITVVRVEMLAFEAVQAANRFNKPPQDGNSYYGVLVDMKYIAGPREQAFTVVEADYRAVSTDAKLRDPSSLIGFPEPVAPAGPIPGAPVPQLRADVYPGSTLTGWVYFELPRGQPAAAVWKYSSLGERGVWFALQ